MALLPFLPPQRRLCNRAPYSARSSRLLDILSRALLQNISFLTATNANGVDDARIQHQRIITERRRLDFAFFQFQR